MRLSPILAEPNGVTLPCLCIWLGRIDYQEAWDLQRALAGDCAEGRVGDTLLLLEHPHVYTIGRRGKASDLLLDAAGLKALGARICEVDRGGEVTYHGPGQLVGYPIINLKAMGIGPVAYVRSLEQVLIDTLADFGVRAERIQGLTGVWVGEAKIAAIGVRISRGVTSHGFALNVDPDLGYFRHIIPCGQPDREATSMSSVLGRSMEVTAVRESIARHFGRVFGFAMRSASRHDLEQAALLHVPS